MRLKVMVATNREPYAMLQVELTGQRGGRLAIGSGQNVLEA